VRAVWPAPPLDRLASATSAPPYPVAVGAAAAAHAIPLAAALDGYLFAFAANIVSAAVRLVPLGQTDGLRAMAALEDDLAALAAAAPSLTLDACGSATIRAEIAAMRHETQYTRLFRT